MLRRRRSRSGSRSSSRSPPCEARTVIPKSNGRFPASPAMLGYDNSRADGLDSSLDSRRPVAAASDTLCCLPVAADTSLPIGKLGAAATSMSQNNPTPLSGRIAESGWAASSAGKPAAVRELLFSAAGERRHRQLDAAAILRCRPRLQSPRGRARRALDRRAWQRPDRFAGTAGVDRIRLSDEPIGQPNSQTQVNSLEAAVAGRRTSVAKCRRRGIVERNESALRGIQGREIRGRRGRSIRECRIRHRRQRNVVGKRQIVGRGGRCLLSRYGRTVDRLES